MKTNLGCELPCWWGITPGKTTWEEMVDTFVKRKIGVYQDGQLNLTVLTKDNYQQDTIDVKFQKKDEVVQSIDIETWNYYVMAGPEYAEAWKNYRLDRILSQYGIPTQVYLELTVGAGDWTPGMHQYYDLWLEYANKGIAIRYPGELIHDNQGWHVCPISNTTYGTSIRLRTPSTQEPMVTLDVDNPFRFGGTLGKLTGITLPQFYEKFKQSTPLGCLFVTESSPWYDKITLPKPSMILPAAQEEEYLVNNLASNADCELPCWWTIKPGETSAQSVQQMFLNLGKSVAQYKDYKLDQPYWIGSLLSRHSPYPFDYVVQHRWYADKNGVIKLFGVIGYSLNWSPPQHFMQDWHRYSLPEALARYGPPSKILLHYWNFGWQYSIGLVYEDKGFLIHYVGPIPEQGKEFTKEPVAICPTKNQPTSISIWMTDPQKGYPIAEAFDHFGYGYPDSHPFSFTHPLEQATHMTVQTFYDTFLNPDATTCLTPHDQGDMAP